MSMWQFSASTVLTPPPLIQAPFVLVRRAAEATPIHVRLTDIDGDGLRDMVLRFQILDTGIKCGDTSAILTGQISSGQSIIGSSPLTTVQCKQQSQTFASRYSAQK